MEASHLKHCEFITLFKIMAEENVETENSETSEEAETSEETKSAEEATSVKETFDLSDEVSEANKKLYARAKKAEAELKVLKEKPVPQSFDEMGIIKTVSALRSYNEDELSDIALIAKAKNISMSEAAKDEVAQRLVVSRREKVEKEAKPLSPSGAAGFISGITDEEIEKSAREGGAAKMAERMAKELEARSPGEEV